MQKSSDMVYHHLLQLISRSISVVPHPSDLSHSATAGATAVFYHPELCRSGSRIFLRISCLDRQSKNRLPLNNAATGGTDCNVKAIAKAERNQDLAMGVQATLRK